MAVAQLWWALSTQKPEQDGSENTHPNEADGKRFRQAAGLRAEAQDAGRQIEQNSQGRDA